MIVIRNIFRIRPGAMKQALALVKRGQALTAQTGFSRSRALTDVAADFYTLVFEIECESLQQFEQGLSQNFGSAEWQSWYQEFTPLIQGGRREIFHIVD